MQAGRSAGIGGLTGTEHSAFHQRALFRQSCLFTEDNEMVELKINWGAGFKFYGFFASEGGAIAAARQDAPGREYFVIL